MKSFFYVSRFKKPPSQANVLGTVLVACYFSRLLLVITEHYLISALCMVVMRITFELRSTKTFVCPETS
jgi:hypothetical protein